MINDIINFLGLLCTVRLFTTAAEPIQLLKSLFSIDNESEYKTPFRYFILKLVNCDLCVGWWFGLIFYHDILLAALVSVSAELIWRIIKL